MKSKKLDVKKVRCLNCKSIVKHSEEKTSYCECRKIIFTKYGFIFFDDNKNYRNATENVKYIVVK